MDSPPFEEPFNELLPEFKALKKVKRVNLNILTAVTTALGSAPKILLLKPELARELPLFDQSLPDRLSTYAMALSHANTLYAMASSPPDAVPELAEEGTALHAVLLADAEALVKRKLIDGQPLEALKGVVGYKNIASDLQVLTVFLWSSAGTSDQCSTRPQELLRAQEIAAALLRAVGIRQHAPATAAAQLDMRNRAFTAFTRAYDELRSAVLYLRRNKTDADDIAPSLYSGRSNGRKKAVVPATVVPVSEAIATGETAVNDVKGVN